MNRLERVVRRCVAILIVIFCRALLSIDKRRKESSRLYHLGVVVVVTPTAYLFWTKTVPEQLFGATVNHVFYQVFHFFAAGVTAFVFSVLLKAILPWILYLPYAAEMRALGLLRISTEMVAC